LQKLLQTNIYFVNVKVDFPYDCREKVPAASGKYDCIFPTIVGKRRLRLGLQKLLQTNIYEVNVKGDFPYDCREKGPAASGRSFFV
jgi:hypothetical protein